VGRRAGRQAPALILAGLLAVAAPAAGQSGQQVSTPCDPELPAALRLVAPQSLPTGFRGGAFLVRTAPGYPKGPSYPHSGFGPFTVAPAEGGPLTHAYTDRSTDRRDDAFLRWPVRFEKGDGPARVTVRYVESQPGEKGSGGYACSRELSAIVRHEPMAAPNLKLGKRRITGRYAKRGGSLGVLWTIRVRGTLRKSATRPVLLEVYLGPKVHRYALEVRKRVKPSGGRFSAVLKVFSSGVAGPGGIQVRAKYPGDLPERWPCADFIGHDDTCTVSDPRKTN
jgi:hypothetical protein